MVGEAQARRQDVPNAHVVLGDIEELAIDACDFVVSYYTLRFLGRPQRLAVMRKVAVALPTGGAFVVYEKVHEPNSQLQDTMHQLYGDFKLSHGFSAAEVPAKTRSLRAVLEPQTSQGNIRALREA